MPDVTRRAPASATLRVMVAALAAIVLFTTFAVGEPPTADAASTLVAKCGVRLRTAAKLTSTARTTIRTGAKVTVVATVSGGYYRTTCAGSVVMGVPCVVSPMIPIASPFRRSVAVGVVQDGRAPSALRTMFAESRGKRACAIRCSRTSIPQSKSWLPIAAAS